MYFNYALLVTTLYIWEGNCIIPLVTIKRKDLAAGHQDHLQTLPGCSRFNPVILFPWGTFLYYFPNLIREEKKQSEYLHDGYLGISGWNPYSPSPRPGHQEVALGAIQPRPGGEALMQSVCEASWGPASGRMLRTWTPPGAQEPGWPWCLSRAEIQVAMAATFPFTLSLRWGLASACLCR